MSKSLRESCIESIELGKQSELKGNELAIHIAKLFLSQACPSFLQSELGSTDDDRLVKIGRGITALFQYDIKKEGGETFFEPLPKSILDLEDAKTQEKVEKSLELVVAECEGLMEIHEKKLQVPKVRFGKTNIQMPIITMGCMRFQQSWNRHPKMMVQSMTSVEDDCQANLKEVLRYAIKVGINHIETARMYGSSEMQLGVAIKELIESKEVKREDLIIQCKVASQATIKEYRDTFETSIATLQTDYFDMYSFHGVNSELDYKRIFEHCEKGEGNEDDPCNCLMDVAEEYIAAGRIKHVGFTSHGMAPLIRKVIETDKMSYANLHYHYFGGSYTTTGEGLDGGNLGNIRLCHEKDMGMFTISPFDKGGRLYAPSRKLRDLTLPDFEPINFGALWLWLHDQFDEKAAPIHTFTVGVARPSDFDQPLLLALTAMKTENQADSLKKVNAVIQRCEKAKEEAVGKDFLKTWHEGLYNGYSNTYGAQLGNIVWYSIIIKAFGMVQYSRDRYTQMEDFLKGWDFEQTTNENIMKIIGFWGWMPGCAIKPGVDYSKDLSECPEKNRALILESIAFAHEHINKSSNVKLSLEWQEAYDMRSWTSWCERPPPTDNDEKKE